MTEDAAAPVFPNLAIITVNLNLKNDTEDCVRSLQAAGAALEQFVVVDNASWDDSVAYLRNGFGSRLSILECAENLGYAHGLNLGIQHGLKEPFNEWFLLINNDTVVDKNFLVELQKATQETHLRLLGPVIFYYDSPGTIWGFGDRFIPGTLIGYSLHKNKPLPERLPQTVRVDVLNGCAMLVHRSVFERIGLFDTSFFMYAEEVDFCWRARQAGFTMACATEARMRHKVSASAGKIRVVSAYLRVRNQIRFYRRYQNFFQMLVMVPFTALRALWIALRFLVTGHPGLSKSAVKGWIDGWFA